MPEIQTVIGGFKGLDETLSSFDEASQRLKGKHESYTRSMNNVTAIYGKIIGRRGLEKLFGLTTQATGQPIGLAQFDMEDDTQWILEVTTTNVYTVQASGLTDITGVALTGNADSVLSWDVIDDNFVFTNGIDPVRKWPGTGNTADIGGTPPDTARLVKNFEDFLFLGDVTVTGTRFPSRIRYSDDWDATWDSADEINLVETHLGIKAWDTIGRTLYVYKGDGIVAIRFIGGPARFSQHRVPFALGIQAPMSLVNIPQLGHIFLASDFNLYLNANGAVNKLPSNLRETLHTTMSPGWAQFAVGAAIPEDDLYVLFFSAGGSWADKKLLFNYRSGEWSLHSYPNHRIIRAAGVRLTGGDTWATDGQLWSADSTTWIDEVTSISHSLITAMDDRRVYRMDTGVLDDTFVVDRTYFSDWQKFGYNGVKTLNGVDLWFKRASGAKVAISVARDYLDDFAQRRIYPLDGDRPDEGDVLIQHRFMPIMGNKFNFKFEYIHERDGFEAEMKEMVPLWTPQGGQEQRAARTNVTN